MRIEFVAAIFLSLAFTPVGAGGLYGGECHFRFVEMNNNASGYNYLVGRDQFTDGEIIKIESNLKKYNVEYEVEGSRLIVPCDVYSDFDFLHNLSAKSELSKLNSKLMPSSPFR